MLAVPRFVVELDAAGLLAAPIPLFFAGPGATLEVRAWEADALDLRFMFNLSFTSTGRSFEDEI
jgi:hypothetical protein